MVHEKFIYRNGKKYGPYLYENHRVGGKVVTSYVGRTTSSFGPHVHTMPILFGGIVLLFLILASLGNYTTQYAVFEVTTVTQGVPLEGLFSFELQPGQVLLEHAEVTLVLGNASRSLPLSSVLLGTDYGNLGTRGGEITFQYRLHRVESTEESTSERVSEEEVVGIREEEILEGNTFATEEVRADESSEVAEHDEALVHLPEIEAPSDSEDSFITGQVIASEETFDGVVSASQPFIFVLGEGDLFELVMGSVQYGEETLSDDTLSLTETEQGVALRADSFFIETGYGTDYSQGTDRTFSLNLSAFHLMLQSGLLGVTLVSEGQTFVSEVTSLDFGNAPLLQLQEFPVYRALPGDIVTLSLTDYFAGIHEVAFLSSSLEGTLEGSVLSFHIPESFSGVAQGLVRMTGGDGGVTEEAFTVLVSSGVVSITTARERIVVGEPVLWTLNVSLAEAGMVTLDLPIEAKIVLVQERGGTVDEVVTGAAVVVQATGDILVDEQTVVETLGEFVSRGITGNVIAEDAVAPTVELMSTAPSSFIVTYTTPAPQAIEQSTAEGTQIVISGPETLEYTDVIASTHLDEEREGTPVLYWEDYSVVPSQLKQVEDVLNSTLLEDTILEDSLVQRTARIRVVPFDAYDLNFNGKTDYIEWVVPHLSNQTFHLIYVSFAGHYSSNGTFLEDITSQVFARDGQYTSPLAPEHVVRVTFEENLTAVNDITLFAYSLGTTSVLVLDTSTGEHVASFDSITSDRKYRVLLSGLTHPQAMFDLIISGDPLVIDQIIDPPAIIINFPQNTTYSTLPLYFNISLSENGTAWYSLNGGETNYTMSGDESLDFGTVFNATNGSIADGQYTFRVYANDTLGNVNTTMNVTFSVDTLAPLVTIVRPANTSYSSSLVFNVSLHEAGSVNYTLTNGLLNYTMTANSSSTGFNATNTSIASGSYVFRVFARDGVGNVNTTRNVTFSVDTTSPLVTLESPANTTYTSLPLYFNISLSENGTAWYSLNGGVTNKTMTANASRTGFNATNGSLANGQYVFRAYANDSVGNMNTTLNITFSLASPDIVAPLVTIVRPSNISYNSILYFNVSLNENGTVWYSLTNGLVNYTMSGNETLDFGTMFNATNTSIADGSYTFKAYANDTLGNYNGTSQVTFTVERVSPIVTIILPTATSYTSLPVRFNVSLNENGTAWYTLNGGLTNHTMTRNGSGTGFTDSNGTIVSGSYTFKAYANDSAGNVNYSASPVSFSVSLTSLAGTRTRSGGGSSGSVAPTATPSVSSLSLSFDKKQLDLIVKRGQRSSQTVLLKNTGNTELAVSLTINGSKPPISILNPSFTLAAGAIEQINLTVLTSDETALDVYALSLVATANGLTKLLPLIVMVKEPQALFDMSLSLEKFLVVQAGRLEILLDLLNVGDTKQADVVLEYFVQPFGGEKEKIYEDTFAVDKKQKHTSDIFLPNSLLPGEYLLSAKMTYGQSTATSAVKFSIIERSVIYLRMLLIAGLSIAIALVGLLLFVVSRTAQNAPSSSLNRPSLPLGAI